MFTFLNRTQLLDQWKAGARRLKVETYTLLLAYRHPQTPWYAKLGAALVVGYAFSPIDLIPDFIPVLGYLDDLILLPLGVILVIKMIPDPVLVTKLGFGGGDDYLGALARGHHSNGAANN